MREATTGVVLVGHGGIPKDYPGEDVMTLKRLEAKRRAAGLPMSKEEYELDQKIRCWPRTPASDPYQAGLEQLATALRAMLKSDHFSIAYNEFCTPTLEEAIEQHIADGAHHITVVSTMFTPGGSHSEYEIPEELATLRHKHPAVVLTYAWPFDLGQVAAMLAAHLHQFQKSAVGEGIKKGMRD